MYKFIAVLSLVLVSNLVSASVVKVDAPAFKGSSTEHNNKSSQHDSKGSKKDSKDSKKKNSKQQHAVVDYSDVEFADNPFDTQTLKPHGHDNKFRKQQDESFLMLHRDAEHKPRHIDFDEFKRDHRGFDDYVFGHTFHDRKHGDFGGKFEYGYCDKPDANPVPLPAAAWLFISGLAGLVRMGHRRKK